MKNKGVMEPATNLVVLVVVVIVIVAAVLLTNNPRYSSSQENKDVLLGPSGCTDTDAIAPFLDGKHYYLKGTAKNEYGSMTDVCNGANPNYVLNETYCNGGAVSGFEKDCRSLNSSKYVCYNGACKIQTAYGYVDCYDSDGGLVYNKKGNVTYYGNLYNDACLNNWELNETYCSADKLASKNITCADCVDGVCYNSKYCVDNDVSNNIYLKGEVKNRTNTKYDSCSVLSVLRDNSITNTDKYNCSFGYDLSLLPSGFEPKNSTCQISQANCGPNAIINYARSNCIECIDGKCNRAIAIFNNRSLVSVNISTSPSPPLLLPAGTIMRMHDIYYYVNKTYLSPNYIGFSVITPVMAECRFNVSTGENRVYSRGELDIPFNLMNPMEDNGISSLAQFGYSGNAYTHTSSIQYTAIPYAGTYQITVKCKNQTLNLENKLPAVVRLNIFTGGDRPVLLP